MLSHNERMQLARHLCEQMLSCYEEEILICGLYGSTARGTDTPWSDLEMWFIAVDGCQAKGRHLLYRDTAVGYRVYERSVLEEILTTPSIHWPFHMGVLSQLQLMHGNPSVIQSWIELGRSIPRAKFIKALEEILPDMVVESHGRIHSSVERSDNHTLFPHVFEVLFEMLTVLCLLNQRWVTRDYYPGLVQSFAFPKLPAGYQELVPSLYEAHDPDQTLALADQLVANYWDLLTLEGVQITNHQAVTEISISSGKHR